MESQAQLTPRRPYLSSDRLASLTDTIFGVAMTLLATALTLPVPTTEESVLDILRHASGSLWAVLLSFAISASYWGSQQRRLAALRELSPPQVRLHLIFLLLIVLLPISTSLLARGGMMRSVVTIYGAHLALIGIVHLLLWLDIHRRSKAHVAFLSSCIVLGLFMLGRVDGFNQDHEASKSDEGAVIPARVAADSGVICRGSIGSDSVWPDLLGGACDERHTVGDPR